LTVASQEKEASRRAVSLLTRSERLLSLDAFRGITIAGMILVNNPGTWRHTYGPLRHVEWNGWTTADLIFPFFLFIVGVAITLSLGESVRRGARPRALWPKVLRRTAIIFGLGIFLNGFPFFHWATIRIPGVLQRIALCYCLASIIMLTTDVEGQAATAAALLIGYWLVMKLVPVPGHGAGDLLERGDNLAAYVDQALLHGHMLRNRWDPEGVLSTFPATATTLAGVLTGHWLRSSRTPLERVVGLFVVGNIAIVLGLIMDAWIPINKSLWTSSFVVFTTGMALQLLAMCYWLIDVQGYRVWAKPFVIYGTNPLLAYLLSSLMDKALMSWVVTRPDGLGVVLKTYIFERFFLPIASRSHASFLYALLYTLLWLGLMAILYRRRIFVKI
jgi:predicted acyltransferase